METRDSRLLGQRVAAELRAEMARQGRSRRWMGAAIGQSHVTVGRWVTGETAPGLEALDSMCRALGMSIADLLAAVDRNGGYTPTPLGGCAIRDSNPEPADLGHAARVFEFPGNVVAQPPVYWRAPAPLRRTA